jgi:plasmid stabilization system protein ParE
VNLQWTGRALSDLSRLHDFLATVNAKAAGEIVRSLTAAPLRLAKHPHLGEKLDEFSPSHIRRIFVGHYEIRYEVRDRTIFVLRIWHTREDK